MIFRVLRRVDPEGNHDVFGVTDLDRTLIAFTIARASTTVHDVHNDMMNGHPRGLWKYSAEWEVIFEGTEQDFKEEFAEEFI